MRLDRLRSGLLGGPLLPGGVADIAPLSFTARPSAENVNEAIGNEPARSELKFLQRVSGSLPPASIPRFTEEYARDKLRGAMSDGVPSQMGPPSPQFTGALGELSDLVQGKAMGRMIPETPPIDASIGADWDEMPKASPLQSMQPVDPSYGDLFKRMRPY